MLFQDPLDLITPILPPATSSNGQPQNLVKKSNQVTVAELGKKNGLRHRSAIEYPSPLGLCPASTPLVL